MRVRLKNKAKDARAFKKYTGVHKKNLVYKGMRQGGRSL